MAAWRNQAVDTIPRPSSPGFDAHRCQLVGRLRKPGRVQVQDLGKAGSRRQVERGD